MEVTYWSTHAAPGKEVSYWRSATCQAVFEVEIDIFGADRSLEASISDKRIGPIRVSTMSIGFGQRIYRSHSAIHRSRHSQFDLIHLLDGEVFISQCGYETELKPGQWVLIDSREPYRQLTMPGSRNQSFHLPLDWLQQWISRPEICIGQPFHSQGGWGTALTAIAGGLDDDLDDLEGSLCADQIAGLLALTFAGKASPQRSLHRLKLYNRIRGTLSELADDPAVDATRIAAAHNISLRNLHATFAGAGTSFGAELRDIRLKRARRALADSEFHHLSIENLAWKCGFSSAAQLTRNFHQRFGLTPGRFRQGDTAIA